MPHSLRNAVLVTLCYLALLEAMLVLAIVFWPDFQANIDQVKGLASFKVLKGLTTAMVQGGVSAYVAGQHFFKGCSFLGSATAVLLASGVVASMVRTTAPSIGSS